MKHEHLWVRREGLSLMDIPMEGEGRNLGLRDDPPGRAAGPLAAQLDVAHGRVRSRGHRERIDAHESLFGPIAATESAEGS